MQLDTDTDTDKPDADAEPQAAPAAAQLAPLTQAERERFREMRAGGTWGAGEALAAIRRQRAGENYRPRWMGEPLELGPGKLPPCAEEAGKADTAWTGKLANGWVIVVKAGPDYSPDWCDPEGMGYLSERAYDDYDTLRTVPTRALPKRGAPRIGGSVIYLSRNHYRGDWRRGYEGRIAFEPHDFYATIEHYRKQGCSRHDAWCRARSMAMTLAISAACHYRGEAAPGCEFFSIEAEVYEHDGVFARCIGSAYSSGEYANADEAIGEAIYGYDLVREALSQAHRDQGETLIALG